MAATLFGQAIVICFDKARKRKCVSFPHLKYQFSGRRASLLDRPPDSVFPRRPAHWWMSMKRKPSLPLRRPLSPVMMEWQDCSSVIEADIPSSVAYECYSIRELIPQWMPFISSVKVLKDNHDLSLWSLKYDVFGHYVEFSWLAQNIQPIPNQKIHWRSLDGLPNRGAVRFYPKDASSCRIELSVSYEVPQILAPVALVLKPFLEGLLLHALTRFVEVARAFMKEKEERKL